MLGDDYVVLEALDGLDAWTQLQQDSSISVVFTDLQMPEMNGMQLLDNIRDSDDEHINALPVIMITGADDTEAAKKEVYEHGATDFISKPFDSIDLLSRAKSYARLTRKVVELEKQAGMDKLTGLLNATSFEEQGSKTLSFAQRHRLSITVVHLEIDDFQNLFLKHGKNVAQQIIVATGKKMAAELRAEDIAARTGVAKYALLFPLTSEASARIAIARIREALGKLVFDTGTDKIRITMAGGIASHDVTDGFDFRDLLSHADQALADAAARTEDKLAVYAEEATVDIMPAATEADIQAAFMKVYEGDFYQIPELHLQSVMDRLAPFMDYVEKQKTERLTASSDST
jgi:diguanylate cyclase (GGDEF)-like protein